ncbi:hypothetical protein M1558_01995 [Candidatus Parvarchaeota archaeon]|jgi:hypothetical protein|nr:hypothetical protein [Candidatus Parvarchaeota archaeon]
METRLNFSVSYNDLLKIHNNESANFDKAYELILNKDPWQNLDNVIEFLSKWNTRVPIHRNKEEIKKAIISLKATFNSLENVFLEDFNTKQETLESTERIFGTLSKLELKTPMGKSIQLKSTGVSKVMHAINPNLFVMWDNGICEYYGCYPNAKGYLRFMETMQGIAVDMLKEHKREEIFRETNRTLPKLLDEYNWVNFSTSKMKLK